MRNGGIVALLLGLGLLAGSAAPASAKTSTFVALLNGGQETPPNTSKHFGIGFFTFDTGSKMLCFAITTEGITNNQEGAAHIHDKAPGQPGPIIFGLAQGNPKNGCVGPLNRAQVKDLRKGLLYVNVHTLDFLDGEIRGQIVGTSK